MRFANAQKVSRRNTLFAPRRLGAVKLFDALRIPSRDARVIRRPRRPGDLNVKIQWLRAGALVAEASLKRLKTDVIALFYQPRVDLSCRSKTFWE